MNEEYQKRRAALLDKKSEVEARLVAVKEAVTKAKREFAATGKRADPLWLTNQEAYMRRLGLSAQELQRQLGELKAEHRSYPNDNIEILALKERITKLEDFVRFVQIRENGSNYEALRIMAQQTLDGTL